MKEYNNVFPILERARESLNSISAEDMTVLRSFKKPPESV